LWGYDLETKNLHLVLKPFAASSYFFMGDSTIYYSEPTGQGTLQLKRFDGHVSQNVGRPDASETELASLRDEKPFYSFSIIDYEELLPSRKDTYLRPDPGGERLIVAGKEYLTVTQGEGWDGFYYCTNLLRSVFLPGDKYFLFNTPYCGNYDGQLLFEVSSGRYQKLPKNTVVFTTLNTDTCPLYHITSGAIEVRPLHQPR
jgi:hypothetical protein